MVRLHGNGKLLIVQNESKLVDLSAAHHYIQSNKTRFDPIRLLPITTPNKAMHLSGGGQSNFPTYSSPPPGDGTTFGDQDMLRHFARSNGCAGGHALLWCAVRCWKIELCWMIIALVEVTARSIKR